MTPFPSPPNQSQQMEPLSDPCSERGFFLLKVFFLAPSPSACSRGSSDRRSFLYYCPYFAIWTTLRWLLLWFGATKLNWIFVRYSIYKSICINGRWCFFQARVKHLKKTLSFSVTAENGFLLCKQMTWTEIYKTVHSKGCSAAIGL